MQNSIQKNILRLGIASFQKDFLDQKLLHVSIN